MNWPVGDDICLRALDWMKDKMKYEESNVIQFYFNILFENYAIPTPETKVFVIKDKSIKLIIWSQPSPFFTNFP